MRWADSRAGRQGDQTRLQQRAPRAFCTGTISAPGGTDRSAVYSRDLIVGRRGEDRTPDPGLVRAVLSQLSYPPIVGISEASTKKSIVSELIVRGIVLTDSRCVAERCL